MPKYCAKWFFGGAEQSQVTYLLDDLVRGVVTAADVCAGPDFAEQLLVAFDLFAQLGFLNREIRGCQGDQRYQVYRVQMSLTVDAHHDLTAKLGQQLIVIGSLVGGQPVIQFDRFADFHRKVSEVLPDQADVVKYVTERFFLFVFTA